MSRLSKNSKKNNSEANVALKDHYYALRVCSRIRHGLKNGIELSRIRAYLSWFQTNYLEPHFEIEEKYIFPKLGHNVRVKRALANHRRIRKLLSCNCEDEKVLNLLEEELAAHIRFEEKILFKELGDNQELAETEYKHHRTLKDDWQDRFWT